MFGSCKVDMVDIRTDVPYQQSLFKFFSGERKENEVMRRLLFVAFLIIVAMAGGDCLSFERPAKPASSASASQRRRRAARRAAVIDKSPALRRRIGWRKTVLGAGKDN